MGPSGTAAMSGLTLRRLSARELWVRFALSGVAVVALVLIFGFSDDWPRAAAAAGLGAVAAYWLLALVRRRRPDDAETGPSSPTVR
jgi:hypothetical protein